MDQVSVIIPNYNHAKYLDKRIQSVLNQNYPISEIIILDDCSIDDSIKIISKYQENPKIKIVVNDKNSGSPFEQWNKGIKLAKGELIWIAESDDFASPEFLFYTVSKFNDPNVVLSYSNSYIVDVNSKVIDSVLSSLHPNTICDFNNSFKMNGILYLTKYLIHFNSIPNASSVVFKKDVYIKVLQKNKALVRTGDWLTWMKFATQGDIVFDSSYNNYFRIHSNSVTAKEEKIVYKYGLDTREEFAKFLMRNKSSHLSEVLAQNNYYISLDRGERGLEKLKNYKIISALKDILFATFTPKFKSYYIKKALSICFRF